MRIAGFSNVTKSISVEYPGREITKEQLFNISSISCDEGCEIIVAELMIVLLYSSSAFPLTTIIFSFTDDISQRIFSSKIVR